MRDAEAVSGHQLGGDEVLADQRLVEVDRGQRVPDVALHAAGPRENQ